MRKFEVFEVNDLNWSRIISLSNQYDFYHTQSYSLLVEDGRPILCVAFLNYDFIAIPLIIRKIDNTDFVDCTSVYGYCGPVSNKPYEDLSTDHIVYFQVNLMQFFIDNQIISAFSRLHPMMNQSMIFENFGTIKEINKTVAIDLRISKEEQISKYRSLHRRQIKKLRNDGYYIVEPFSKSEIDEFINIYHDSMTRLNADISYFFGNEYFYNLLKSTGFKTKLFLAKNKARTTAGGIFTITNSIMQYHLGATRIENRKESPMKIIIDHARLFGNNLNLDILHLGGGVSGSSDDSLFYFKSGFSDLRFIYSVWQLIIDEPKYFDLINSFKINLQTVSNYFPAYRAK